MGKYHIMSAMIRKDCTYEYHNMRIPYVIWFTDDSKTIDTVIFLGSGQIDKLPEWVAEACPPKTAIIQGAPHWHARPDGSDIPEYMFEYTRSAFDQVLAARPTDTLHVIADSQAVPGVVKLFTLDTYQKLLGKAVFIQPLGLTARIFGGTDEERMSLFKKRVIWNGYHQILSLISDRRLRYNHRLISRVANFKDPVAIAHYNSGLLYDSLPDIKALYLQNRHISIICGSNDRIFPAHEIESSLGEHNLSVPVFEINGVPHSPLATKKGLRLLGLAFKILNSHPGSM